MANDPHTTIPSLKTLPPFVLWSWVQTQFRSPSPITIALNKTFLACLTLSSVNFVWTMSTAPTKERTIFLTPTDTRFGQWTCSSQWKVSWRDMLGITSPIVCQVSSFQDRGWCVHLSSQDNRSTITADPRVHMWHEQEIHLGHYKPLRWWYHLLLQHNQQS